MGETLQKIKQNMLEKEILLSCYACKSEQAVKLREEQFDMRPDFFKDIDRIIHSLGYTSTRARYRSYTIWAYWRKIFK